MLYPLSLLVIPPSSHPPTLVLPTLAPVASTLPPGAHVSNLNSRAPAIGVEVANGLPVRSIASATLASVPSLPTTAMQGHVMPSFPHTLVGLGPFADDQDCKIVFTKMDVAVLDPQGHCILKGWREAEGARLWRFPLTAPPASPVPPSVLPTPVTPTAATIPVHPSSAIDAFDDTDQACSVSYKFGHELYLAYAARSTKTPFDPRSLDLPSIGALVDFYHACLGFPVKQT
jgi:hypothetical protein